MNRRLALRVGAVAAVILLAWTFLLWRPKGEDLAAAKAREEAASAERTQLQVRLDRLRQASEQRPALELADRRLRLAVPSEPELAQFILAVDEASKASGVEFMTITPSRPAPATGGLPPAVRVELQVNGEYFASLDFLNRLLALDRVFVIDSLAATPQAQQASPRLGLKVSARLFSETTGAEAAPVAPAPASPAVATAPPPAGTSAAGTSAGVVG